MPTLVPLDVTVHIIKHQGDKDTSYVAHVTIGNPDILLPPDSVKIYRCGASGKSVFACLDAIQERALAFMETNGITYVSGLTDNKPSSFTIRTGQEEIEVTPVTYNDCNDMSAETQRNNQGATARITVWRESENLFVLITRERNGDPVLIPVASDEVLFSALTRVGQDDERTLKQMTISELKRPTPIALTWFDTREIWKF